MFFVVSFPFGLFRLLSSLFFFLFFGSSFLSSYPNVRGENAKIIAVHIRYSLYAHTDVNAISKNQYLHMQLITTFAFPIYMS